MKPQDLSNYLRSIALYAETNRAPSRRAIVAGLQKALYGLTTAGEKSTGQQQALGQQQNTAGPVSQLVDENVVSITKGFATLIDRLTKAADTLNPQSESKASIEKAVSSLQSVKAEFTSTLNEISQIEV